MSTAPAWQVLIGVPRDGHAPALVRHTAKQAIALTNLLETDQRDLVLALSEVVKLAVGAASDIPGQISVLMRVSDAAVELQIRAPVPTSILFTAGVAPGGVRRLPDEFRLIHEVVDSVTLSLEGNMAVNLTKKRRTMIPS